MRCKILYSYTAKVLHLCDYKKNRLAIRNAHYSYATEKSYWGWIRHFIKFHQMQHPEILSDEHIAQFLSFLTVTKHVSVSTQKQALSALVFLYKKVFHRQEVNLPSWSQAKRLTRLPLFSLWQKQN